MGIDISKIKIKLILDFSFYINFLIASKYDAWKAGKGGKANVSAVAIVVPVIVVVLLLIAGYCFLTKRKKKAYDTAPSIDGKIHPMEQIFIQSD